jgi:hypothetical protein
MGQQVAGRGSRRDALRDIPWGWYVHHAGRWWAKVALAERTGVYTLASGGERIDLPGSTVVGWGGRTDHPGFRAAGVTP